MGFLRRLLGGSPAPTARQAPATVPSGYDPALWHQFDWNDLGDLPTFGTRFHQEAFTKILKLGPKPVSEEVEVGLVREPANPKDRNAVAVLLEGRVAGYIPHERASAWSAFILQENAAGLRVRARGTAWGVLPRGAEEPGLGLYLRIPDDPADTTEWEAERARRAAEKAERAARYDAAVAAGREARAVARAERGGIGALAAALEAHRRAAGLCVVCGVPVERIPRAKGRPPVRCAVHLAEATARREGTTARSE
jgi:hypothetical protein